MGGAQQVPRWSCPEAHWCVWACSPADIGETKQINVCIYATGALGQGGRGVSAVEGEKLEA